MYEDFSDELISAYLDGELTGAQKARVETVLMDSAEHRRMFEELRGLRESLQSLPSYRLGDEFADRVLQAAEQVKAKLKVTADSITAPSQSAVDEPPDVVKPDRDRHEQVSASKRSEPSPGSWRRAAFAIAAVAAALLLAVFLQPPPTNDDQHIADGREETSTAESKSAGEDARPVMTFDNQEKTGADAETAGAERDAPGIAETPCAQGAADDAPAPATSLANNGVPGKRGADFALQASDPAGGQPTTAALDVMAEPTEKKTLSARDLLSSEQAVSDGAVIIVDAPQEFLAARAVDATLRRHDLEIVDRPYKYRTGNTGGDAEQLARRALEGRMERAAKNEADGFDPNEFSGELDILVVQGTPDQIAAAWTEFQNLHGWYEGVSVHEKGKVAVQLEAPADDADALDNGKAESHLMREANRLRKADEAYLPHASDGARNFGGFGGGSAPLSSGLKLAPAAPADEKDIEALDTVRSARHAAPTDEEGAQQRQASAGASEEKPPVASRIRADRAAGPRPAAQSADKANEPSPAPAVPPPTTKPPQAEPSPSPDAAAGPGGGQAESDEAKQSTIDSLGDKEVPALAERQKLNTLVAPKESEEQAEANSRPASPPRIQVVFVIRAVAPVADVPAENAAASESPASKE